MPHQKIYFLPTVYNINSRLANSLVFWRKISQNEDRELNLFLAIEGRDTEETGTLGKELWEITGKFVNEAIINHRDIVNLSQTGESILKILNDFFVSWKEKNPINNWNEIHLIVGVANPTSMYFSCLGEAKIFFWRNGDLFIPSENLSPARPTNLSPPFVEVAEGILQNGDKILITTPALFHSFSEDELSSLAASQNWISGFQNIVRSIELLSVPINVAFLWGEVSYSNARQENFIQQIMGPKIREYQVKDLNFKEFNLSSQETRNRQTTTSSFIPWKKIIEAGGKVIVDILRKIIKVLVFMFSPLSKKMSSLSPLRKIILFSSLFLFLVFLGFVSRSLLSKPEPNVVSVDYGAVYSSAEKLRQDAQSALIYQDEEKARKNLASAISLLDKASSSSEWGIKSLKLKGEIEDELATLEKASNVSEVKKLAIVPDDKGELKGMVFTNKNKETILISAKWIGGAKIDKDNAEIKDIGSLNWSGKDIWPLGLTSKLIIIAAQDRSLITVNLAEGKLTSPKEIGSDFKGNFSAASSFGSNVYFFDPADGEIKLFAFENDNLIFKRNWLNPEFAEELKKNPISSISIDGSVFALLGDGQILRFSGGKKTAWKAEDLTTKISAGKGILRAKAQQQNLYALDPERKRIVVFEKESGKLKSQLQNNALSQAVDFEVDENEKVIYFITSDTLFKMQFEL